VFDFSRFNLDSTETGLEWSDRASNNRCPKLTTRKASMSLNEHLGLTIEFASSAQPRRPIKSKLTSNKLQVMDSSL
jgi:hypothetical protein